MDWNRQSIILASASPRRADLLRAARIPFERRISAVDENSIETVDHEKFAVEAARLKALDVARLCPDGAIVVGADTIVCLGHKRLGKPTDRDDAKRMLRDLAPGRHEVKTGLVVVRAPTEIRTDCVTTSVWFGSIPESDLEAYLDTAEPYDKAGAYAIQGWAGGYIERIEGDYHNVVGLPVRRLIEMLGEFVDAGEMVVPKAEFDISDGNG